jgi:hypothetical protein
MLSFDTHSIKILGRHRRAPSEALASADHQHVLWHGHSDVLARP